MTLKQTKQTYTSQELRKAHCDIARVLDLLKNKQRNELKQCREATTAFSCGDPCLGRRYCCV